MKNTMTTIGNLRIILLMCLVTHNAFASLIPTDQWAPGTDCYTNSTKYKVAVCDCIGYHGSIGNNRPKCDQNSPTSDICLMGTKTELFTYEEYLTIPECMDTNTGEYRAIEYVCFNPSSWPDISSVCDCNDYVTDWVRGSDTSEHNNRYTRTTAKFQCGTYTFSTYCEYKIMDPETEQYTTYTQGKKYTDKKEFVCGPSAKNYPKIEYACTAGSYLKPDNTCELCPDGAIGDTALYSTSPDLNQGNVRSCYIPKYSFTISDDIGQWTWSSNCTHGTNK